MDKQPRRRFLKQLGTAGAAVALTSPALAGTQSIVAESCFDLGTAVVPLESWSFALDPEGHGESQGWFKSVKERPSAPSQVTVPHTWQVSAENAGFMGVGWYWTEFEVPSHWAGRCVRIEFEAVFHTAKVWLNDKLLGEHPGRGYTAFTFDATPALRFDAPNFLAVKVDNSFNADILPRSRSYDWAQDGGITRPVSLLVAPSAYIDRLWIDAVPDLDSRHT
ncbi:MAG: sugar-binding domain-containing protein, partial [Terriglobia bacterium]